MGRDRTTLFAYSTFLRRELKVYVCADTTCSSGTASTLDSIARAGGGETSIAIRSDNNTIIAYYCYLVRDLRVYVCSDTTCSSGTA